MKLGMFMYDHDYEGDTKVETFKDGDGFTIKMSFTSEDPDYGTETLTWVDADAKSLAEAMATLLDKISDYLDEVDQKHDPAYCKDYDLFGDCMITSMYAFEGALGWGLEAETMEKKGEQ